MEMRIVGINAKGTLTVDGKTMEIFIEEVELSRAEDSVSFDDLSSVLARSNHFTLKGRTEA
jgi:hypothetical protein